MASAAESLLALVLSFFSPRRSFFPFSASDEEREASLLLEKSGGLASFARAIKISGFRARAHASGEREGESLVVLIFQRPLWLFPFLLAYVVYIRGFLDLQVLRYFRWTLAPLFFGRFRVQLFKG